MARTKTHPADAFITTRPVFHSAVDKGYHLNLIMLDRGVHISAAFSSRGAARARYTATMKGLRATAIAKHGSEGCPRCRMDLIKFNADVKLPRFTMTKGETWNLPQSHYDQEGSAALGDGTAHRTTFYVVERDATRASHNGLPCPGNPTMEQTGGAP